MATRDGDGWVQCSCGNKHWGLNGAAGLLLLREGKVLMQHRAPWVHNGDTWGIPGGARDSHETILEGALREAIEEIGINPSLITPLTTHLDDHGPWRYDTVIARAHEELVAHEVNEESHAVAWVEIEKVEELVLHPSFANNWPALRQLLTDLG